MEGFSGFLFRETMARSHFYLICQRTRPGTGNSQHLERRICLTGPVCYLLVARDPDKPVGQPVEIDLTAARVQVHVSTRQLGDLGESARDGEPGQRVSAQILEQATDEIEFPAGIESTVVNFDGVGWREGRAFAGASG